MEAAGAQETMRRDRRRACKRSARLISSRRRVSSRTLRPSTAAGGRRSRPAVLLRVGRERVVLAGPRRRLPRPARLVGVCGVGRAAAFVDVAVVGGAGRLSRRQAGIGDSVEGLEAREGLGAAEMLLFGIVSDTAYCYIRLFAT